jgi:predicted Zn-dependent protease
VSQLGYFRTALLAASLAAGALAGAPRIAAQTAPVDAAGAPPTDMAAERQRREAELRDAVRANPNDTDARNKLAHFYSAIRNYPAAEAELRESRRIDASNDDTVAQLAWVLSREGKTDALFDQIKPADREPSAEASIRLCLGLTHFSLREIDAAEPLIRDAVKLNPGYLEAHLVLARLFIFKGQLPDARVQIELARGIAPNDAEILQLTGNALLAEGDAPGAVAQFSKLLDKNPNDATALSERGAALIDADKLDEAQRDIDAALKRAPKNPRAIYLDALLLARQGKIAAADAKLTTIINSFGQGPSGYYLHGVIKFLLGQYEQADADFAKVQGRSTDAAVILRLRAEAALRRKDTAGAIFLLKPEVASHPADRDTARVLARADVAAGHPEQALALYAQMAEAPPDGPKASPAAAPVAMSSDAEAMAAIDKIVLAQHGSAMVGPLEALRRGDLDEASTRAEALAKSQPDDPDAANLLGSVRRAQQRLPEAEAIFRALVQNKPEYTPAAFNLAEVLVAEKRPDDATVILQGLAQRAP